MISRSALTPLSRHRWRNKSPKRLFFCFCHRGGQTIKTSKKRKNTFWPVIIVGLHSSRPRKETTLRAWNACARRRRFFWACTISPLTRPLQQRRRLPPTMVAAPTAYYEGAGAAGWGTCCDRYDLIIRLFLKDGYCTRCVFFLELQAGRCCCDMCIYFLVRNTMFVYSENFVFI